MRVWEFLYYYLSYPGALSKTCKLIESNISTQKQTVADTLAMQEHDHSQPSIWSSNFPFSVVCKSLYDFRILGM